MSSRADDLLDQLAMLNLGSRGSTLAHFFLQDCARGKPDDVFIAKMLCRNRDRHVKFFIPPKPEDRVAMFSDDSGVYIRPDGFCTPMGNIAKEIVQWTPDNG